MNIVTSVLENGEIVEFHCMPDIENNPFQLGNIYVGKVKNIVPNIHAAFIEIAKGIECYYSIPENPSPIFTKKTGRKPLCIGDELLVQISKEAVKTKVPSVTSKLSFSGKYVVLTAGDTRISVSSKLNPEDRKRLKEIASPFASEEYGLIIRTNAKTLSREQLECEIHQVIQDFESMMQIASKRVCYSCMKRAPKQYLVQLRNIYQDGLTDILIEDSTIYEEVHAYMEMEQPEDLQKLKHYQDTLLPLHKLYSVEKKLEEALKERVWLKSGAYLIIQPTEALTVIDVNTGKSIGKKNSEEHLLHVNIEAAIEAAKQIRLRNLSGIILVDFINLSDKQSTKHLLEIFESELKKDPIVTTLVDMTKLQLVEVTRKKVRKPLYETLQNKRNENLRFFENQI